MISKYLIIQLAINLLLPGGFSQVNSFRVAVGKVTPAVVHIRAYFSEQVPGYKDNNFWFHFFLPDKINSTIQVDDASGVIIRSKRVG